MSLFNYLDKQYKDKKPFAVYRKPNTETIIGLFQEDTKLHQVESFLECGFVLAPFDKGERFYIPYKGSLLLTENRKLLPLSDYEPLLDYDEPIARLAFEDLVTRCVAAIKQGKFEKVVPSRKESIEYDPIDLSLLFQKIDTIYPTAFCSMVYHPEIGLWVGATPETLLSLRENKLHTMALAGTQVNHGREEVEWGKKEIDEQAYVTEFIIDTLKPYANSVKYSAPFAKRAAKVMHICTDIEVELKNNNLKAIVADLHPTPAVCGLPKAPARDFLIKEEGYDREYYAGYLGELNYSLEEGPAQATDLYVNLRCMNIADKKVNLFIGCGVTIESDPTSEFIETVNKSFTMKKVLK
ncbi:chorismate-binding protein [Myroides injenensis]|uniref:chorismate-binding protein n=1 Tax=Myroides injenensis TaxID=1183151 RepID=UPI0002887350|nr:chorismate-binding protein [Myroides injenensis]